MSEHSDAARGRLRGLHWYHAPFYLLALPVIGAGWVINQLVDAGVDLYEALTGRTFG